MAPVKKEMVDESSSSDQQHASPNERTKYEESGIGSSPLSPEEINQLRDGPGPLGLRLRKSDSLLDLIQKTLSEGNKDTATSAATKLKVSTFPVTRLTIGTWEYESTLEGDLVARCFYVGRKLIWEVFDGSSKNKIEILWSDIMALKVTCENYGPSGLCVVLTNPPLFFREENPQPRKYPIWEATEDFTGGQAILHRFHYLQCPKGSLDKHLEKLYQSDLRHKFWDEKSGVKFVSPYFESVNSLKTASTTASQSGGQSSSARSQQHDPSDRHGEFSVESPSVTDKPLIEVLSQAAAEVAIDVSYWDRIIVPGINPSMSVTDLVNYVENRITEQRTSSNHPLSPEEQETLTILLDISRCLFRENQHESTPLDQKSIVPKVNSLCSLLHKDPTNFQDLQPRTDSNEPTPVSGSACDGGPVPDGTGTSRKASVGALFTQFFDT